MILLGVKVSGAGMGNSLAGLTYYSNNEDDPYITLKEEVCNALIYVFSILPIIDKELRTYVNMYLNGHHSSLYIRKNKNVIMVVFLSAD